MISIYMFRSVLMSTFKYRCFQWLRFGPKDTVGSFYWSWDPEDGNNLIFSVYGYDASQVTVSVWGCQHIAATYEMYGQNVKVYCDNIYMDEVNVFDHMSITSDELHIGGHPFGRCISWVDFRSYTLE